MLRWLEHGGKDPVHASSSSQINNGHSMPGKTANQIDAEAADWAARVDRGPLSPGDDKQLQDWLGGDVRCPGAYARIRALALYTERAQALGPTSIPDNFVPPAIFAAPRYCGPAAPLRHPP